MTRFRDAAGRFVARGTWELAYRLVGQQPPRRVGNRNAVAPLSVRQIEARATKRPRLSKRTAPPRAKPVRGLRPKAEVVRREETVFPRGTEFELTARYRGNRQAEPRALHVKVRVTLTSALTAGQARRLLDVAVRTGHVPPGIEVAALDWRRGNKGRTYDSPDHQVLRDFYGVIGGPSRLRTRFDPVAE